MERMRVVVRSLINIGVDLRAFALAYFRPTTPDRLPQPWRDAAFPPATVLRSTPLASPASSPSGGSGPVRRITF